MAGLNARCPCGFLYNPKDSDEFAAAAHDIYLKRLRSLTGEAAKDPKGYTIVEGQVTHWLDSLFSSIEGKEGPVTWGKE